MHKILFLPMFAAATAMASPVMASGQAPESEMIEKLNDPEFQDGLASMMNGFMGAMMEIPIGQLAHSIEKAIPESIRRDRDFSDMGRLMAMHRINEIERSGAFTETELSTTPRVAPFFEKFGFKQIGFVKDGFAPGMDQVQMRKSL